MLENQINNNRKQQYKNECNHAPREKVIKMGMFV